MWKERSWKRGRWAFHIFTLFLINADVVRSKGAVLLAADIGFVSVGYRLR